jgi:hypothetical protein
MAERKRTNETSLHHRATKTGAGRPLLCHDHCRLASPGSAISASAVQHRGTLCPLRRRAHRHVSNQERAGHAVLTRQMHTPAFGRVACKPPRLQAGLKSNLSLSENHGTRSSQERHYSGSPGGTVARRCKELSYSGFTPYAVDLVCFDLRMASRHEVTVALASDTQAAHDAVDRELVVRYHPGQKREGLLLQLVGRTRARRSDPPESLEPRPFRPASSGGLPHHCSGTPPPE